MPGAQWGSGVFTRKRFQRSVQKVLTYTSGHRTIKGYSYAILNKWTHQNQEKKKKKLIQRLSACQWFFTLCLFWKSDLLTYDLHIVKFTLSCTMLYVSMNKIMEPAHSRYRLFYHPTHTQSSSVPHSSQSSPPGSWTRIITGPFKNSDLEIQVCHMCRNFFFLIIVPLFTNWGTFT